MSDKFSKCINKHEVGLKLILVQSWKAAIEIVVRAV